MIASATGAIAGGLSASAAADYNAAVAEQDARLAREAGAAAGERTARQGRLLASKQAASYLTSGVGLSGSPLDVIAADNARSETDALYDIYNANIRSGQLNAEANLQRQAGSRALLGGLTNAAGSILTGTGDIRRARQSARGATVGTG